MERVTNNGPSPLYDKRDSTYAEDYPTDISTDLRICLVGKVKDNRDVVKAAVQYCPHFVCSPTGLDYVDDSPDIDTCFVLNEFEGPEFDSLRAVDDARIIGVPLLIECARNNKLLPIVMRPLFNLAMHELIITFTGFTKKEEVQRLGNLVHHMGGSVRKEFSQKVTHLVAKSTKGEKYRYAITFNTPVMQESWINETWNYRHMIGTRATNDNLMQHIMKPFVSSVIHFVGFSPQSYKMVTSTAIENGGTVVDELTDDCTHIVVEATDDLNEMRGNLERVMAAGVRNADLVKAEWFWASITMNACAEKSIYYLGNYTEISNGCQSPLVSNGTPVASPSGVFMFGNTPVAEASGETGIGTLTKTRDYRKRKRLVKETMGQLQQQQQLEFDMFMMGYGKRKSIEPAAGLSMTASFLDATCSPDKTLHEKTENQILESPRKSWSSVDLSKLTTRQKNISELLGTEANYVTILNIILTVFKEPIDKADQAGGPILSANDSKMIFGNIPPLRDAHVLLCDDLHALMCDGWRDDIPIGAVIKKHVPALAKCYPAFVNFFQERKKVVKICTETNKRFYAFLQIARSNGELHKQTLDDFLIRPIQRMASMELLLKQLLKNTDKSNPDYADLVEALKLLNELLVVLNEGKRQTEARMELFEIANDIENCDPTLLHSNREFVLRINAFELSGVLRDKDTPLTLFLFTDAIEFCKKKSSKIATPGLGTKKSPSILNLQQHQLNSKKGYKHLQLMFLNYITAVFDIEESEECQNGLAFLVRDELKTYMLIFSVLDDNPNAKAKFIKEVCKQIGNVSCKVDPENILRRTTALELELDPTEKPTTMGKAIMKFATKTQKTLGRTFSFGKTPRGLKRTMSTMIASPYTGNCDVQHLGPGGSNKAAPYAQSSVDLQESPGDSVPPMGNFCTPQSGRKFTSSSLGVKSGKRFWN